MIVYEPRKTRPLSDFYPELRFEFPNVPEQLFQYYLVRTARDMARSGDLLRRTAVLTARPGVTRYRLVAPENETVLSVLDILKEAECPCAPDKVVPRTFVQPETFYSCTKEIAWYDDIDKIIHINGACCAGRYLISLSVLLDEGVCELPEEFYTLYFHTLLMGTKAGILMITGRPWTNMRVGGELFNEYRRLVQGHAFDVMRHKQRGAVKMQFGRAL